MSVTVRRLFPDRVLDYRFVVLSHNTIRGAAGAAVLNAELLVAKGYLKSGGCRLVGAGCSRGAGCCWAGASLT